MNIYQELQKKIQSQMPVITGNTSIKNTSDNSRKSNANLLNTIGLEIQRQGGK